MPLGVTQNVKKETKKENRLVKGEVVFHQNGPLLAIKWCVKRSVTMLTTIYDAIMVESPREHYQGHKIVKP